MFIFKAKGVSKEWNGKVLFEKIDLELRKGEHVALFGRNGTGKTTLLNGLLGRIEFDTGSVQHFEPFEDWGILEQDPIVDSKLSTLEFVQSASEKRYRLKKKLADLQTQMAQSDEGLKEYHEVYDQFLMHDGYNLETEAEVALHQVNLNSSTWEIPYMNLSGGQKTRAQLARLVLQKPTCIIMDEPTNHLDKETIEWLEEWIQNYSGAVLFVSHDRMFLDHTAHKIYELNADECKEYIGDYTAYKEQKEIERRTQETLYRKQEQKRKELQDTIERYQKWFHQAHKAAGQNDFTRSKAKKNVSRFKAKEKELERLESSKVHKPQGDNQLHVNLDSSAFSARRLMHIENVSFGYEEDKALFSNLNKSINRGDRIGLIGPNGSGKSTLLRLIVGKLKPSSGMIKTNPQTKIGYFAQELEDLDQDKTILESMLDLPGMTQSEARTILGCFLFSREAVFKKIADLSMGEKCRIAFLNLYFSNANFLVLDEPTNFLDVDTKEIIEDVLQAYPGALIVVSHDRYLIKKIANQVIELEDNKVMDYSGGYDEYIEYKNTSINLDLNKDNKIRELELRLTQLITMEADDVEEQQDIMVEIKSIREKLDDLK